MFLQAGSRPASSVARREISSFDQRTFVFLPQAAANTSGCALFRCRWRPLKVAKLKPHVASLIR
ncbi:hypothetical protein T05_6660 [Trichinella murrelli]|uniref:Uncharacterized protein n=1 Tax=Trichinella murrelli TaxID=144512 RepID=A0A0V0T9T3_9BILA|nr:hypothetical protein T05_6660 [Trichinella murrelli]